MIVVVGSPAQAQGSIDASVGLAEGIVHLGVVAISWSFAL